jgi:hypothetical protein
MLVSSQSPEPTMDANMQKLKLLLTLFCAGIMLSACEPSPEEQALDPVNCEQMKDIPDAYQRCLDDLR